MWQASTYPQSKIITVRELMVTNSLEVDCLQIELELDHHQSAIELRISFSQGKCTNTPIQEVLLPPHLWKSKVKFKLCFPTVVLSNGIIGSTYKQSATDKGSQQHLMGYHVLLTVICHSHSRGCKELMTIADKIAHLSEGSFRKPVDKYVGFPEHQPSY